MHFYLGYIVLNSAYIYNLKISGMLSFISKLHIRPLHDFFSPVAVIQDGWVHGYLLCCAVS